MVKTEQRRQGRKGRRKKGKGIEGGKKMPREP